MLLLYLVSNLFYVMYGVNVYKKIANPLTVYSIVWVLMISSYELKLIYFYELSMKTWLVIMLIQFVFFCGMLFSNKVKWNNKRNEDYSTLYSAKNMELIIIGTAILSSVGIISNLVIVVSRYGVNLLDFTNQIYRDRLYGDIEHGIPYLGSIIFTSLLISGFYYKQYGFKLFILFPISLMMVKGLITGGRLDYILGLFLFVFPIVFGPSLVNKKNKKKKGLFSYLLLSAVIISVISMFIILTNNRSSWIEYNPYMTPEMGAMVQISPAIYSVYKYISTPVGVLNQFLIDPDFSFGGHTFLTLYNLLNKFGANIEVSHYQKFYYFPIESNVGTYIRELVEDFTLAGALIVTFLFSVLSNMSYKEYVRRNSLFYGVISAHFILTIFMSFYMWQFRSSYVWISLLASILAIIYLKNNNKGLDTNEHYSHTKLQ